VERPASCSHRDIDHIYRQAGSTRAAVQPRAGSHIYTFDVDFKSTRSAEYELMSPITFGSKLRKLRNAAGLTLRGLADKTTVDFTYLSKLENGRLRYTPSPETIRSLADALGADPIELLGLANKLPPELDQVSVVPAARRFMARAQHVASPEDWEALLTVLETRHAQRACRVQRDKP
jgi:transcriptional regulator with XRE-family HTH domain